MTLEEAKALKVGDRFNNWYYGDEKRSSGPWVVVQMVERGVVVQLAEYPSNPHKHLMEWAELEKFRSRVL